MADYLNTGYGASVRHKVFISYHHANDQRYKDHLLALNGIHNVFIDKSVDTGDIDDGLPNESIRRIIRDNYLRDSSVTILLVGLQTWGRKHIDWELYSSMYDGAVNKKSGILVVTLPSTACITYHATHAGEKELVYPETTLWCSLNSRAEYEARFPLLPARIIDNLMVSGMRISVVPWTKIENQPSNLRFLINAAHEEKTLCDYDLSRPMRRSNS